MGKRGGSRKLNLSVGRECDGGDQYIFPAGSKK